MATAPPSPIPPPPTHGHKPTVDVSSWPPPSHPTSTLSPLAQPISTLRRTQRTQQSTQSTHPTSAAASFFEHLLLLPPFFNPPMHTLALLLATLHAHKS
ncbi:hypothetical protein ACFX2I_022785 [Malus domestica]